VGPSRRWLTATGGGDRSAQSQRRAACRIMVIGGVFLGLGVVATIVSYSVASAGDTYFVFYGAMIFGALDLVIGLVRYLRAPNVEDDGSVVGAGLDREGRSSAGVSAATTGPAGMSAVHAALSPMPAQGQQGNAPEGMAAVGRESGTHSTTFPSVTGAGGPQEHESSARVSTSFPRKSGGHLCFDEAAIARLREQTRMYYAQQSMRAQGRCEICGRALARTARWRGAVRCPQHL
jgi:hypothetical protein